MPVGRCVPSACRPLRPECRRSFYSQKFITPLVIEFAVPRRALPPLSPPSPMFWFFQGSKCTIGLLIPVCPPPSCLPIPPCHAPAKRSECFAPRPVECSTHRFRHLFYSNFWTFFKIISYLISFFFRFFKFILLCRSHCFLNFFSKYFWADCVSVCAANMHFVCQQVFTY